MNSEGTPTIYLTEVSHGQQKEIVSNVSGRAAEPIIGRTLEVGEGRSQKPDTRGDERTHERSLSDDSRGQQKAPSISEAGTVQQMPTQNTGNSEVQFAISERNTYRDNTQQGDLQGVQAEVKAPDTAEKTQHIQS